MSVKKQSEEKIDKSQDLTKACKEAEDEVAKIGELESRLIEAKQAHKSDLEKLRSEVGETITGLQRFCDQIDQAIARIGEVSKSKIITPAPFKFDKTKEGWKLIERGPVRRITDVSKLKPEPFLKKGEDHVNGEVMRDRAKEKGCDFGQGDLEYVLEHQDQIPKKLRSFYLVFPGTIWRGSDGSHRVLVLYWDGGRWCLGWGWLWCDWDSRYCLLSARKF